MDLKLLYELPQTPSNERLRLCISNVRKNMDFKPIGYIESGFKFKNGTPRQPSVCGSARARLTVNHATYSNPEHSLDGLADFSHVWVIFVFHQNNNPYKKAKVKPPRLNGAKVGVFSTRSPYRLNPIGLTLAKIESVEGATLHLSGVDMLDGTPVLDVKPYIPLYDQPQRQRAAAEHLESPEHPEAQQLKPTQNEYEENDTLGEATSNVGVNGELTNACKDFLEKSTETEYGINIEQKKVEAEKNMTTTHEHPSLEKNRNTPERTEALESTAASPSASVVGNKAGDSLSGSEQRQDTENSEQAEGGQGQVEYADWIKTPPFHKLSVRWTPTAEAQLQRFSKEATDDRYRLEFIKSTEEARKAVHDILHADPRSSYRRKKCVDRLYFFMVDVLHVTCWFNDDESVAEVVRIKPNREKMLQKLAEIK